MYKIIASPSFGRDFVPSEAPRGHWDRRYVLLALVLLLYLSLLYTDSSASGFLFLALAGSQGALSPTLASVPVMPSVLTCMPNPFLSETQNYLDRVSKQAYPETMWDKGGNIFESLLLNPSMDQGVLFSRLLVDGEFRTFMGYFPRANSLNIHGLTFLEISLDPSLSSTAMLSQHAFHVDFSLLQCPQGLSFPMATAWSFFSGTPGTELIPFFNFLMKHGADFLYPSKTDLLGIRFFESSPVPIQTPFHLLMYTYSRTLDRDLEAVLSSFFQHPIEKFIDFDNRETLLVILDLMRNHSFFNPKIIQDYKGRNPHQRTICSLEFSFFQRVKDERSSLRRESDPVRLEASIRNLCRSPFVALDVERLDYVLSNVGFGNPVLIRQLLDLGADPNTVQLMNIQPDLEPFVDSVVLYSPYPSVLDFRASPPSRHHIREYYGPLTVFEYHALTSLDDPSILEAMSLLVERGANVNFLFGLTVSEQHTLLDFFLEQGFLSGALWLSQHGGVSHRFPDSPLPEIALAYGHYDLAHALWASTSWLPMKIFCRALDLLGLVTFSVFLGKRIAAQKSAALQAHTASESLLRDGIIAQNKLAYQRFVVTAISNRYASLEVSLDPLNLVLRQTPEGDQIGGGRYLIKDSDAFTQDCLDRLRQHFNDAFRDRDCSKRLLQTPDLNPLFALIDSDYRQYSFHTFYVQELSRLQRRYALIVSRPCIFNPGLYDCIERIRDIIKPSRRLAGDNLRYTRPFSELQRNWSNLPKRPVFEGDLLGVLRSIEEDLSYYRTLSFDTEAEVLDFNDTLQTLGETLTRMEGLLQGFREYEESARVLLAASHVGFLVLSSLPSLSSNLDALGQTLASYGVVLSEMGGTVSTCTSAQTLSAMSVSSSHDFLWTLEQCIVEMVTFFRDRESFDETVKPIVRAKVLLHLGPLLSLSVFRVTASKLGSILAKSSAARAQAHLPVTSTLLSTKPHTDWQSHLHEDPIDLRVNEGLYRLHERFLALGLPSLVIPEDLKAALIVLLRRSARHVGARGSHMRYEIDYIIPHAESIITQEGIVDRYLALSCLLRVWQFSALEGASHK